MTELDLNSIFLFLFFVRTLHAFHTVQQKLGHILKRDQPPLEE